MNHYAPWPLEAMKDEPITVREMLSYQIKLAKLEDDPCCVTNALDSLAKLQDTRDDMVRLMAMEELRYPPPEKIEPSGILYFDAADLRTLSNAGLRKKAKQNGKDDAARYQALEDNKKDKARASLNEAADAWARIPVDQWTGIKAREDAPARDARKTPAFPDDPVDLWAQREAPLLPKGLLPPVIEEFAFSQGKLMGCDPAGLAMGALAVCAAAIPDDIKLQVKKHDRRWLESTRIWIALGGPVSAKKSPIMRAVCDPIDQIDADLARRYNQAFRAYKEKSKDEQKTTEEPVRERVRIEDATPESVQNILQHNSQGVFLKRDELSGWFGQMDKYAGGGRGASADRGFWLQSFNGGFFSFDRVGRGSGSIENLSVSMLGGIQIEALLKVVGEGVDDGLLQRLFVIMLHPAVLGMDEPLGDDQYDALIGKLYELRTKNYHWTNVHFTDEAAEIRWKLEQKHLDLASAYEKINRKLSSHIGKYDGLFARLCLLWQVIENIEEHGSKSFAAYTWPGNIEAKTAQRVADFLHGFILKHAIAFYVDTLGLSDDHDRLSAVAGYILARELDHITRRDVQRGDHTMRKLTERDTSDIFAQLEALGWLVKVYGKRYSEVHWVVNPQVHIKFKAKAAEEAKRRERQREEIVESLEEGK